MIKLTTTNWSPNQYANQQQTGMAIINHSTMLILKNKS